MGNYGVFVLGIPILIAFFYWKNFDTRLKLFFWYLIAMIGINAIQQTFSWAVGKFYDFWKPVLSYFQLTNTHFFNILSMWVMYGLLGLFFSYLLKNYYSQVRVKQIIIVLCIVALINHLFIEGFRSYGVYGVLATNLFTLFFATSYLWFISNQPPNISFFQNPFVWICMALFLYTLALMIFGFYANKLFQDDRILFIKGQIGISSLNLLSQIAYCIAFSKAKYTKYLK
jgi:hypothetical protein